MDLDRDLPMLRRQFAEYKDATDARIAALEAALAVYSASTAVEDLEERVAALEGAEDGDAEDSSETVRPSRRR